MDFAGSVTQEPTVSLGSSNDLKEQVRQATDIVELVGSYVSLRRQGRNYVGLCPWHDDSKPSLQVNAERQSFKCWVCDIGGDVFSFVMQMEGVTFPEAMNLLAEKAGIALKPIRRPEPMPGEEGPAPEKSTLLKAAAWAEQQYHECLTRLPEGEPGRQYLAERGLSAESIAQWHLGFSPESWDWILQRAEAQRANTRILESIGILTRGAGSSRPYDRFRGRVLFSIRDAQNRPIALGGRILPSSTSTSPAKYVNSPETPLFRKSEQLYGLDIARDAIRKSRTVLVMEGYTDCIMAHQFGFSNAVAVLGTALGEGHIRILKRFADKIVLVLDGDEAGMKRANEVLDLFVAQQVDLRIVTLPLEKDPCDFLLKQGADAFRELLETGAVDALEHAFQTATYGIDVTRDTHAASQAIEKVLGIIAKAPRQRDDTTREVRLREEMILQRLAARFRIDEQEVRNRMSELRRKMRMAPPPAGAAVSIPEEDWAEKAKAPIEPWERELLEILIQHPGLAPRAQDAIDARQLTSPICRLVFETACRLIDAGDLPTYERLMLEFNEMVLKKFLVDLEETGRAKSSFVQSPDALLDQLIEGFRKREALRLRPAQAEVLREGQLDDLQQLKLLETILQQERARQGISKPTDG